MSVKSDSVKDLRTKLDFTKGGKAFSAKRSLAERNFIGKMGFGGAVIVSPAQAANYRERHTTDRDVMTAETGNRDFTKKHDGVVIDTMNYQSAKMQTMSDACSSTKSFKSRPTTVSLWFLKIILGEKGRQLCETGFLGGQVVLECKKGQIESESEIWSLPCQPDPTQWPPKV